MDEIAKTLLTIGGLFLLGLATDALGRRARLPRVTLLLIFGLLIGPSVLNWIPDFTHRWFPVVSDMALLLVGFLLGEKLAYSLKHKAGDLVLWVSMGEVLVTLFLMAAVLMAIGVPVAVALVLAGVAPATDPAATSDVVREMKARGKLTTTLLGVVAIDDAWGLVVFSFMLAIAVSLKGQGSGWEIFLTGGWELAGAFLVGVGLGVPMAYLTGRVQPGEPTLMEALGGVFLAGGLSLALGVSFLLTAMVMGVVVALRAEHHERPFHAIEDIEWPFLVLFFIMAGASLEIEWIAGLQGVGLAYLAVRVVGQVSGAWLGARMSGAGPVLRTWLGVALMPQAGVAIGMTLVAANQIPEIRQVVFPVVIASTVIFEIIGPVLTRIALIRAGEAEVPRSQ